MLITDLFLEAVDTNSDMLYHVTTKANAAKIMQKGILPMQTSNWVYAGNKERYGDGNVFAFTHKQDAARWAAKMDWEFNKKMGSGQVCIIEFTTDAAQWRTDTADPIGQAGSAGNWLKLDGGIPPEQIKQVTIATLPLIKQWLAS